MKTNHQRNFKSKRDYSTPWRKAGVPRLFKKWNAKVHRMAEKQTMSSVTFEDDGDDHVFIDYNKAEDIWAWD